MTPWSPVAKKAQPLALGYRRGKFTEASVAPCAVIVHTTGSGPVTRATADKFAAWRARHDIPRGDTLRCALTTYSHVMDACAHYVIGQDGEIVQLVPESHVAHHVGGRGSRPYFNAPKAWHRGKLMAWWTARWAGYDSPRGLGGGHLWDPPRVVPGLLQTARAGFPIGSCNANTIGIEVVAPLKDPKAPWSAEAWHSLTRLVLDICARHQIPVERDRVISHSDAHPLSRTSGTGRPWDPGSAQWSWDRFERSITDMRPQATA